MRNIVLTGLALTTLAGCMTARTDESREMQTRIDREEGVVVLAKPQIEGAAAEDDFMDCISDGLAKGKQAIRVHGNNDFVDRLFPWFEPGTAPTRPEGVSDVLARPGVSEVVASTGVRYVVWLDGGTRKTDGGGSLACGAAPGAVVAARPEPSHGPGVYPQARRPRRAQRPRKNRRSAATRWTNAAQRRSPSPARPRRAQSAAA